MSARSTISTFGQWPDGADETPHKAANLYPARPLARPQHGRDKATFPVKHDDRLEAVIVVIGIEEAELLSAMHSVEGVVDIEHDALRHRPERTAAIISMRKRMICAKRCTTFSG